MAQYQKPPRASNKMLFELGLDKIKEIDSLLLKGKTTAEVARVIQEEWGLLKPVQKTSLERAVRRYREDTLKSQMALIAPSSNQGQEEQRLVLKKLVDQIDPIAGLQELANIQKERLQKALSREQQLPFLLDHVSGEVSLLGDLYVKMGKMMMDVGILKKMLADKIPGNIQNFGVLQVYSGQVEISENVKLATQKALSILNGEFKHVGNNNQTEQ